MRTRISYLNSDDGGHMGARRFRRALRPSAPLPRSGPATDTASANNTGEALLGAGTLAMAIWPAR